MTNKNIGPSFDPARFTRRQLLRTSARLATLASAAVLMPANIRRALAQGSVGLGSMHDIKHVVMLMQENRSFDHYFGSLAGVRGFNDPAALQLSTGRSVFYQPDAENPDSYMLPFHLNTRTSSAQKIPSTDHGWDCQHAAWHKGKMDQWLSAHRQADGVNGPYCMGYYKREDIPFQYALAEAFTLCDAYHCSQLGPTVPNRLYWMTGTIDPEGKAGGPFLNNKSRSHEALMKWTTYAERLEAAGISWKVYQQEDHWGPYFNVFERFETFQKAPWGSSLRNRAMVPSLEGQFEDDAMNDRLPAVSWILPTSCQSEHPDFMPAAGAAFVASKIDAIAANPDVWAKTAFILNYDENDGLFDHVPPPVPPPGTENEFVGGLPIGAGFRVPCIIVSPWTGGGWVCSEPFDHTSVLRFLEKFTGVHEPNISDWRRQTFGDLTSAFRFEEKATPPAVLPDTSGLLTEAGYQSENFPKPVPPVEGGCQQAPTQEMGERQHVPRNRG
jgi:phospholipase C